MPRGIATAKQLAMIKGVLDAHCEKHAVLNDVDREELACLLLTLFDGGARTTEALSAALEFEALGSKRPTGTLRGKGP